ncbi:hypothetical protein MITS9509_00412 [Synechococcus sp. MIT S9509]|nr:hypothetical protein MITS9504_02515 [Synechococcus sp. MIT S9504]KZR93817.1 hypothetical protein MITS9509_00412 [Synechococcus sp. MIT S9509]
MLVVAGDDPKLKAKLLAREEQRTLKQQQQWSEPLSQQQHLHFAVWFH